MQRLALVSRELIEAFDNIFASFTARFQGFPLDLVGLDGGREESLGLRLFGFRQEFGDFCDNLRIFSASIFCSHGSLSQAIASSETEDSPGGPTPAHSAAAS
jgi:hypothetical protein